MKFSINKNKATKLTSTIETNSINSDVDLFDEQRQLEHKKTLKGDLSARRISMMAIGGALGRGLLIGTGTALATAGPASVLIAFSVIGLVVYCVMCSLAGMATYIPLPDGLVGYGSRYVYPALAFTMGYSYLLKYFISTANQYVALAIQYWIAPENVNPGVWITVYLILAVGINFVGVGYLGEVEF